MPTAPFVSDMLNAIRLPDEGIGGTHTEGVFALLIGAAMSVLESRSLIARYSELNRSFTEKIWSIPLVSGDVAEAVTVDGAVDWRRDNLIGWSAGFFLNKAQQNLAAALDRCVNAWMGALLGLRLETPVPADEGLMFPHVVSRLRIISALAHDGLIQGLTQELSEGFERYGGTDDVSKRMEELMHATMNQREWPNVDHLYTTIAERPPACTAMVFTNVNKLKHAIYEVPERSGAMLVVETAVSARATQWIGGFWRTAVAHIRETRQKAK